MRKFIAGLLLCCLLPAAFAVNYVGNITVAPGQTPVTKAEALNVAPASIEYVITQNASGAMALNVEGLSNVCISTGGRGGGSSCFTTVVVSPKLTDAEGNIVGTWNGGAFSADLPAGTYTLTFTLTSTYNHGAFHNLPGYIVYWDLTAE